MIQEPVSAPQPDAAPAQGTERAVGAGNAMRRPAWRQWLWDTFALDLRSLALVRVLTAVLLLVDLEQRIPDFKAHYTDAGALPSLSVHDMLAQSHGWSFHLFVPPAIEALLFVAAGLCGLALLVGYRTRLATVASFVLLLSLQNRDLLVLSGADDVQRLLLLWGIFLPWGACYSVDAALGLMCPESETPTPDAPTVTSMATVAYTLQVLSIYWFNALNKSGPAWHSTHTAVYDALSISTFATPFAYWLLRFPALLKLLTIATLLIECYGPWLLFIPFHRSRLRLLLVALFIGFHAGLWMCMTIGLFAWLCAVAWLAFLPSSFWEWLGTRGPAWGRGKAAAHGAESRKAVRIYYDNECDFCIKAALLVRTFLALPEECLLPAQSRASVYEAMERENSWVVVDIENGYHYRFEALLYLCGLIPLAGWVFGIVARCGAARPGDAIYSLVARHRATAGALAKALKPRPIRIVTPPALQWCAAACLFFILIMNLRRADLVRLRPNADYLEVWVTHVFGLTQSWAMFAPVPARDHGWFVVAARLKDGSTVDLYRDGAPLSWKRPALVSSTFANNRWRAYMMNLTHVGYAQCRRPYLDYLCRMWNQRHPGPRQVVHADLYFLQQMTLPDRRLTAPKTLILEGYNCCESLTTGNR